MAYVLNALCEQAVSVTVDIVVNGQMHTIAIRPGERAEQQGENR